MRLVEFAPAQDLEEKKKKKKSSRSLRGYFFPGYAYYGSSDSGEGSGDGGGESKNPGMAEGIRDLDPNAQSLIMKLRRDVEEKRLQPTRQAVLAAASELAGDMDFAPELLVRQVLGQGVAEGLTEYKNTPLQDYNGLQFMIDSNHPYLRVEAFAPGSGQQLAQVDFKIDDQDELHPEDLHVEERWRGQGIAQIMYDFVKSKGYTIHRSWSQTDAGSEFWNKHRGQKRVWEQGVAEGDLDERNMGQPRSAAQKPQILSAADDGKTITVRVRAPDGTTRSIANSNPAVVQQWLNVKYGLRLPASIARKFVGMPASMAEGTAETPQQQQVRAAITKGMEKWDQNDKATYQSQPTKTNYMPASGYASDKLTGVDSIDPDGTVVLAIGDTKADGIVKKLATLGGMPGVKTRQIQPKIVQGVAEGDLNEKSTSQAQFRTMAAAAHDPKFAKKVGIKQSVAREFNQADRGQSYKSLPKKA